MAVVRKHLRICGGFLALLAGFILALPFVPGPELAIEMTPRSWRSGFPLNSSSKR